MKTGSPFAHLFGTNHSASAEETRTISDLISGPLRTVSQLDLEIKRLGTVLDKLRHKRDIFQDYIDAHRALLSPIRQLSSEVLAEIFIYCLPSDRNSTRSLSEAPLLLGLVCKRWREVSLSTPHLWTSLHIVIPDTSNIAALSAVAEARMRGVESWLGRSGTLPLSISVYSIPRLHRDHHTARAKAVFGMTERLWKCFAFYSSRWQSIELMATTACIPIFSGLQEMRESFPLLETFRFKLLENHPLPPELYVFKAKKLGEQAPRLRHLYISHISCDLLTEPSTFPCARLSHLELFPSPRPHTITICRALDILSMCPNLVFCGFNINCGLMRGEEEPPSWQSLISFPRLEKLKVVMNIYPGRLKKWNVFEYFDAPALRSLDIFILNTGPALEELPFQSLLNRSDSIEDLRLTSMTARLPYYAVEKSLNLLPNLKTLYIEVDPDSSEQDCSNFLSYLTPIPNKHISCPVLRRLTVHGLPCSISDDQLLEFVRSRRAETGLYNIEFHIMGRSKQRADLEERLDELRNRGVVVVFSYHPSEYRDSAFEGLGE